jgi:peptide/nickel transport system permease protein
VYVISRRIGFYVLTAIAAVTVTFFIPRVMPGNPVSAVLAKMQGSVVTKQTLSALAAEFGSNTREGLLGSTCTTGTTSCTATWASPPATAWSR